MSEWVDLARVKAWMDCPHLSWTGDEGPIATLGRFPKRWRCDGCGEVMTDDAHDCRVYWGSHGCVKARGHDGHHLCDCCECPGGKHTDGPDAEGVMCVATHPYYGPATRFYGEDATDG